MKSLLSPPRGGSFFQERLWVLGWFWTKDGFWVDFWPKIDPFWPPGGVKMRGGPWGSRRRQKNDPEIDKIDPTIEMSTRGSKWRQKIDLGIDFGWQDVDLMIEMSIRWSKCRSDDRKTSIWWSRWQKIDLGIEKETKSWSKSDDFDQKWQQNGVRGPQNEVVGWFWGPKQEKA